MKTKQTNTIKDFDTVKTFRTIKKKIAKELMGKSAEQIKEYLRKNSLQFQKK
ncbi:MAG: hypothetical protein KF781_09440 [Chitinophagaceae bacterium]|nr:hypothetical protein [Chitinophagaceae bacterium]MCW5905466.1 hypothetical protein [Chitinophagaceae bacterium]